VSPAWIAGDWEGNDVIFFIITEVNPLNEVEVFVSADVVDSSFIRGLTKTFWCSSPSLFGAILD